jgi:Holliday junction resolvase RusA-like endonuclease
MVDTIRFIIMGKPVPQPRVVDDYKKKQEKNLPYIPKFDPAAKAKANFALKALQYRPDKPFECPLEVNITWHFERPQRHYGRRNGQLYLRPDAPKYYTNLKSNDRDNLDKFVLDALTGPDLFWIDDGIICKGTLTKLYTDKLPRTEIEIIPIQDNGADQ